MSDDLIREARQQAQEAALMLHGWGINAVEIVSSAPNSSASNLLARLAITITRLADALSTAEAELVRVREALTTAAGWFSEYETLHAAKGSIDGDVKARTNAERADFCARAALESSRG
jgi:predicted esterase